VSLLSVSFSERLAELVDQIDPPTSFEAYQAFHQGLDSYALWEFLDAEAHFRRAFDIDSTWPEPLYFLTTIYYNRDDYSRADSLLAVISTFNERLSPYRRAMLEYVDGMIRGDLELALRAVRRAAELAPGSRAWYNYGMTLTMLNRPHEAIEVFSTLDPERGPMRGWFSYTAELLNAYHRLGDHERELDVAVQSRNWYPNQVEYVLGRQAVALAALGQMDQLSSVLDELENTGNAYAMASTLHEAAGILLGTGNSHAEEIVQRAINWYEGTPSSGIPPWYRAWMLAYAGDLVGALQIFDELVQSPPDGSPFILQLRIRGVRGFVAATRRDSAVAESDLEWLANLDRPYLRGENTFWRGVILGAMGDLDAAVDVLRQAFAEGMTFEIAYQWNFMLASLRDYPPFQELMRPKG
jgi:tetratricopeptide (TPR) repeat protein